MRDSVDPPLTPIILETTMSDSPESPRDDASPFDALMNAADDARPQAGQAFATVFRGYDRDEVDAAISSLNERLRSEGERVATLEEAHRASLGEAEEAARQAAQRWQESQDAATSASRESAERLEGELAAAHARAADAEQKVQTLTEELTGQVGDSEDRHRFDDILRVAEEQAGQIIKNATQQADRLLEIARGEIDSRRADARTDADALRAQAEHDAQQVRLRIDTELTAHQAQIEREQATAAEKVSQAEREADAVRSEAEKGAAALRALVNRETSLARAEAEEAVREHRMRGLEFEESLTRRQDDAQQEFLVLHNQAVAHAERITQDANDQVASSLDHAQRVSARADDFDRLMRAQAQQIEADANIRAREHLDRAREKAQRIIDTVTAHSQSVLRDAEDRARQLRWQQHQLTSFMSEVKELIRPEGVLPADPAADESEPTDGDTVEVERVESERVASDED